METLSESDFNKKLPNASKAPSHQRTPAQKQLRHIHVPSDVSATISITR